MWTKKGCQWAGPHLRALSSVFHTVFADFPLPLPSWMIHSLDIIPGYMV